MLGNIVARWRRLRAEKVAARLGAFASRHRGTGVRMALLGGFALVVLLVHREVFSFITQARRFAAPTLKTALAPRWASRQGEELVRIEGAGRSIFDPGLVEQVGRSFEACPWVRKVTAVERVFPDRLLIRFEYRQPHAAVRRENGFVLVDRDGIRLPGVYLAPPACERATQISGVASLPPEPGKAWNDDSLRAALAMADLVADSAVLGRLGIREIDVANYAGRQDPRHSEMVLATSSGCLVAWGRSPETSKFGDLSTQEKLENLREVLAAYPDLGGLKRVTLYFRGSRAVEPTDAYVQSPGPAPRPRVR